MKQPKENGHAALARKTDLIIKELPDEVLVYDLKRDKAHCLNHTAAFVWNNCDGRTTPSQIAKLMQEQWHTAVSEDAVWFTLSKLSKAELLEDQIRIPESKVGMSRRSAMRRIAFGSLMVPVVMTLVAPTASAGASVPPACQSCVKKSNGIQDCPSECTGAVFGTCYSNSGCGNGQDCVCVSCVTCFLGGTTCGNGTISWKAPGARC